MKQRLLNLLVCGAMLLSTVTAHAIMARPGVGFMSQPDGTMLRCTHHGDEFFDYYKTEDGYLLYHDAGYFYYATLDTKGEVISTGCRAKDVDKRSAADRQVLAAIDREATVKANLAKYEATFASPDRPVLRAKGPGLMPGVNFPVTGVQKVLVVLVEYTDVKFTVKNPKQFYTNMLNAQGFKEYGGTGSARDFFIESSNGIFQPQFDVYGPITLSNNQAYYGRNGLLRKDTNAHYMAIEACQQLDPTVDFTQYDRDGDGKIDNIYIYYAGEGEADDGGEDTVWPQSYSITKASLFMGNYTFDGVKLDSYSVSNEWAHYEQRPTGIGTFCHEFSHVMGLPDLYTTDESIITPCLYSAVDYGPYLNESRTPPPYGAFERYALGYIDPIVLDGPMNCNMSHVITSNRCYIAPTSSANEFFLFENRQQKGGDAYLPGHGMLIWHIDYNSAAWSTNRVNATKSHQYVDLEEANQDFRYEWDAYEGWPWPGTSKKTSFTDATTPNMKTWSGASLGLPITDIKESNGIISFKVKGGTAEIPAPTIDNAASNITSSTFTIGWSEVSGATGYVVTVSGMVEGKRVVLGDRMDVGNRTSVGFKNLEKDSKYFVQVEAVNGKSMSLPSKLVTVTTRSSDTPFSEMQVTLAPATNVKETSFTANWQALAEATGYFLSVYTRTYTGTKTATESFDNGLEGLGNGWKTTAVSTYTQAAYCGASAPSLKLGTDGMMLTTPEYAEYIRTISFWHRGASTDAACNIGVEALVGDSWQAVTSLPVVNATGGTNYSVDLPSQARAARIVFHKGNTGSIAIDDVTLKYGGEVNITNVKGFNNRSVRKVYTYNVTGLEPCTTYYYTVYATNGTEECKPSAEGCITTTGTGGIEAVATDAVDPLGVTADAGAITVFTNDGVLVTVYTATGKLVGSATGKNAGVTIDLPGSGLYIVRAGAQAKKVMVR